MSTAYRNLAFCLVLAWACACVCKDADAAPACSDSVCVVNVLEARLISGPCVDDSVLVAFSQVNGATLIQCTDPSDPEGNTAFVYDRRDVAGKAYELRGGRFIRPDYLPRAVSEGIPDKFGVVPLCTAKDRRPAMAGELLLASKQPNDSQDAPYCYRIHYVVSEKGVLQILSDDGNQKPALSPAETATWANLRESLSPYIDTKSDTASTYTGARVALVSSDKARLFQSPNLDSRTRMYLVKGDHVDITDDTRLNTGWCKVRYVPKSGKVIDAWMQSSDLDRSHK